MAKITIDIDNAMLKKILEDEDYMVVFLAHVKARVEYLATKQSVKAKKEGNDNG